MHISHYRNTTIPKLVGVLRTTNTVDTVPVGSIPGGVNYAGAERSDIHDVTIIKKDWSFEYKYDESGSAIFSQDITGAAFEQGNVDTEELKYPPTPQPSADLLLGESSSDPTTSPSLAATEANDEVAEINSAYHFNCRCCFPLVSYFIFARVW